MHRTLRSSLTLWLALASSIVLAVLCAAVVSARRASFRDELDASLAGSGAVMIDTLVKEDPSQVSSSRLESLLPVGSGTEFCALRDEEGHLLAASHVWHQESLPRVPIAAESGALLTDFDTLDPEQAHGITGREARLRCATIPFPSQERRYFLQLGLPDRSWAHVFGTALLLLSVASVFLAVTAPMLALLITRRVMTPIRALAEIAKEVTPSNLGPRFDLSTHDTELRRLQEELNAALQRLEEGYRAQAQFITNVAHELKTPIAALMADLQVTQLGRHSHSESRAFMRRAEEELRHLASVIESFLVMARIEAQDPRKDLVRLDDVVQRSSRRCSDAAKKSSVRLELDFAGAVAGKGPFVRGDAELLQAMVENLVRNAIHHSPSGEVVVVRTRCENGSARVVVRDHGRGIPEDFRAKVFERGVRGEGGGAGLGLSIASGVARLHGGTVTIEPSTGVGCTFVVVLPAVTLEHGVSNVEARP